MEKENENKIKQACLEYASGKTNYIIGELIKIIDDENIDVKILELIERELEQLYGLQGEYGYMAQGKRLLEVEAITKSIIEKFKQMFK